MYLHHGATVRWEDVNCNGNVSINHLYPRAIATQMVEQGPTDRFPDVNHIVGEVLRELLKWCSNQFLPESSVTKASPQMSLREQ